MIGLIIAIIGGAIFAASGGRDASAGEGAERP